MVEYLIQHTTLEAIANAIRQKEDTTDLIPVSDIASRILGMQAAGAALTVTAPSSVTVTATMGDIIYTKVADSDGVAAFSGLTTGEWTISITDGSKVSSTEVAVVTDYAASITFFAATINVTYPSGATCTCSDGITTLTASDTSGSYMFTVPNAGDWTVSATDGNSLAEDVVTITTDGQAEAVTITYYTMLYGNGDECTDLTGSWDLSAYGVSSHGESLTKNSNNMTFTSTYVSGSHFALGFLRANNKIDLTDFDTLSVVVDNCTIDGDVIPSVVVSTYDTWELAGGNYEGSRVASAQISAGTVKTIYTVDVSSLTGRYYVGLIFSSGSVTSSSTVIVSGIMLK